MVDAADVFYSVPPSEVLPGGLAKVWNNWGRYTFTGDFNSRDAKAEAEPHY